MEVVLIGYLHKNIIQSRIDEEFTRLLATGSNHRDVLVEYYSDTTMKHIVLMEKDEEREVVITDEQGKMIQSSKEDVETWAQNLPNLKDMQLKEDQMLAVAWDELPYIISAHPYEIEEGHSGYVIMFQSTSPINQLVTKLNLYFGLAGVTSIVALLIIYAILSKFLTRPLIRMKEATEQLSEGNFNVSLPFIGNDELGELSGSIQKLSTDLERLKTERNEFLASIAHELSTPLTYLTGYSTVARREGLDEKERAHYLEIIKEEAYRMKELVKNLLDLAKMDENSFTVSKEKFQLKPFLHDLCKLVEPSFNLTKITLDVRYEGDFEVEADPLRLEQILLNLLDNALKYSPAHSSVIMNVFKRGKQIGISVTDYGIGIPTEELDFVFEKLYRVEKSRSRMSGGSGIGLAIVKELVEAHGGGIEVESEVGKGSMFTIFIGGEERP